MKTLALIVLWSLTAAAAPLAPLNQRIQELSRRIRNYPPQVGSTSSPEFVTKEIPLLRSEILRLLVPAITTEQPVNLLVEYGHFARLFNRYITASSHGPGIAVERMPLDRKTIAKELMYEFLRHEGFVLHDSKAPLARTSDANWLLENITWHNYQLAIYLLRRRKAEGNLQVGLEIGDFLKRTKGFYGRKNAQLYSIAIENDGRNRCAEILRRLNGSAILSDD